MARTERIVWGVLVALVLAVGGAEAQSNATIVRALNRFLNQPHTWTQTQTFAAGASTTAGAVRSPDGSSLTPGWAFTAEPGLGFYRSSTGAITVANDNVSGNIPFNFGVSGQQLGSGMLFSWSGTTSAIGSADTTLGRSGAGKITLTGTTPMLQLGGTTSGFPALKQSSAQLQVRLADDSAYAPLVVSTMQATSFWLLGNNISASITAPTINSGFGTSPSVLSNEGTLTFRVNVGTGGAATSGVLTMPAAANGWNCSVQDMTTNVATRQSASTTTTVTVTAASAWAASDTLSFICFGY